MPDPIEYLPEGQTGRHRTEDERERAKFYSSKRWRAYRKAKLAKTPLCERCRARGIIRAANTVHHKVERLINPKLTFAWDNLESVCASCHTIHHNASRAR